MSAADRFVAMVGSPDVDVTSDLFAFVDATSDVVGVVDEESRFVYLNNAACKRLGVDDWSGLTTADVFPPQTFAQYYDEIRPALVRAGTWDGELAVLSTSGQTRWMAMSLVAKVGPGGDITRLVAIGREIAPGGGALVTSLVVDELTGLAGRAILNDRIRVALAHAARDRRGVAVLVVDVDSLKDINDSYGHSAGDTVLRAIARNMTEAVRASDTVARIGGDEFVVLLDGLDGPDTAWQVAERVRDFVCRVPITSAPEASLVTASFGLAAAATDDSATSLLERADAAMYRAKALGGDQVTVVEDSNEANTGTLITELGYAVSHGLIRQYIRSVVDLHTGVLVAYQGLARWAHPQRGLLDAEYFIPTAASTPLIPVIDLDVLRRTVTAAAQRQRDGLRIHAYAHVSRRLLGDPELARYLAEIIDAATIAPHDVRIEVPHTLLTRRSRAVDTALLSLHELGVRTVLAGADGDCAVNQIVEHGFDELRLARHLVQDTVSDATRRRVAQATIALARSLGLTVTAVGIETEAEHDHMRELGCNYGEGDFYGPPREPDERHSER